MAISDPWQAFCIDEVEALLAGLPVRWWIAGGQAIDLFAGSSTRQHEDIDAAVLRADQLALQADLDGWDLRVAHDGRLTRWTPRAAALPPRARHLGSTELSLAMAVRARGGRRHRRQ